MSCGKGAVSFSVIADLVIATHAISIHNEMLLSGEFR